jgi:hypothetical protein
MSGSYKNMRAYELGSYKDMRNCDSGYYKDMGYEWGL